MPEKKDEQIQRKRQRDLSTTETEDEEDEVGKRIRKNPEPKKLVKRNLV